MKTQRCLTPIFTLPSEEGEWQMFAHKVAFKNSNWESGVWEGRASSLSKECELWNFGSSPRVFDTFQVLGVILFLGFVFCVHHWNVSPEASKKEETSNPGQAQQLPEETEESGRRNVLPNL